MESIKSVDLLEGLASSLALAGCAVKVEDKEYRDFPFMQHMALRKLSVVAIKALENRMVCLLANHGAISLSESLEKAMWKIVELETIARQYYYSLMLSDSALLQNQK